jgi:hypothetical protein
MTHLTLHKTLTESVCTMPHCTLDGHAHHPVNYYYLYSCSCYVLLG